MLKLLTLIESNTAFQITVLLGGIATFCAGMLSRADPPCIRLECAGACSDDGEVRSEPREP
jgi:hypothetical protein